MKKTFTSLLLCAAALMPFRPTSARAQGHQGMTDYEAVNQLVVAERIYRTSHRDKELRKLYFADAKTHTSWQSGGTAGFVGNKPVETDYALPLVNRTGAALIRLNGNKAFVEYPMTTTRGVWIHGKEATLTSYMTLLYRCEKRNGTWGIADMTSVNEADELQPSIPGEDLGISPGEVKDFRKSYRWLAYARLQAGGTISQDLLGTDRPDDVRRVYEAAGKWLEEEK